MASAGPEWTDYLAVSELYSNDWNPRARSTHNPLSLEERVGYLVVDYWIRLQMHAFDGLMGADGLSTVAALKAVKLDVQAFALEQALRQSLEELKEESLLKIARSQPDGFEVLFSNAVASYLREAGLGQKLIGK